jgi:O-antigen ligase
MAILLIALLAGLLAVFVLLNIAARIIQAVSLIAIFIGGAIVIAVGYIALFVAGISAALLFQVWGAGNAGWAIFVAGLIGLIVASLLLGASFNEIKDFSVRLKRWLGLGKTMKNEKCTPSVTRRLPVASRHETQAESDGAPAHTSRAM